MTLSPQEIQNNWLKFTTTIEEYISSHRKEKLLDFYKKYEERLVLMPASHKKEYHNAFPGGYIDHVNRVMHPPLHLFLFPLQALDYMLRCYGYKIRAAWLFGQDIYEVLSTLNLFLEGFDQSVLYQQGLAPLAQDLQKAVDSNNLSDEVLIIAEKV